MADNVHITGTDLPPWASEVTLRKMSSDLAKLVKAAGQGSTEEFHEEMSEAIKREEREFAKNEKERGRKKKVDEYNKIENKMLRQSMEHIGVKFDGFFSGIVGDGALGTILKPLTMALDTFVESAKTSVTEFGEAYKQGFATAGTTKDLNEFHDAARKSGIGMDQLSKVAGQYTKAMNQTTMPTYAKLMKTLSEGVDGVSKPLKMYGYNLNETTEYLGEYLETQRLMGTLDDINSAKFNNRMAKTVAIAEDFAKMLGISTDELKQSVRENVKNLDEQRMMRNVHKDNRNGWSNMVELMNREGNQVGTFVKGLIEVADAPHLFNKRLLEQTAFLGEGRNVVIDAAKEYRDALMSGHTLSSKEHEEFMGSILKGIMLADERQLRQAMESDERAKTSINWIIESERLVGIMEGTVKAGTNAVAEAKAASENIKISTEGAIQREAAMLLTVELLEKYNSVVGDGTKIFTESMNLIGDTIKNLRDGNVTMPTITEVEKGIEGTVLEVDAAVRKSTNAMIDNVESAYDVANTRITDMYMHFFEMDKGVAVQDVKVRSENIRKERSELVSEVERNTETVKKSEVGVSDDGNSGRFVGDGDSVVQKLDKVVEKLDIIATRSEQTAAETKKLRKDAESKE